MTSQCLVEYQPWDIQVRGTGLWPQDFEVYSEHGYAYAIGGNELDTQRARRSGRTAADEKDSCVVLKAVVRGRLKAAGLFAGNNMIVVEILEAAGNRQDG